MDSRKMDSIFTELKNFNWAFYNGPEYYNCDQVVPAFQDLFELGSEGDHSATYNKILSVIGNNHAGTYYPVAEKIVSYLIENALCNKNEVSRNCSLEILMDLYFFSPEVGDSKLMNNSELERKVKTEIRGIKSGLIELVKSVDESERNIELANEFLQVI